MSPQARDATIKHFSEGILLGIDDCLIHVFAVNNVEVTVFLVSLKAGGVALNLTEASRVYLMDSWWNPAVCLHYFHPRMLTFIKVEYRMHSPSHFCNLLHFFVRGYGPHSPSWSTQARSSNQACDRG
jgi:hypothetical protein